MKSNNEMLQNKTLLNKCQKIYSLITIIYASVCTFYAGVSTFQVLLGTVSSPLITAVDGILLKALLFFCGLMTCYKHQNKYALFAIAVSLISVPLNEFNILISIMTIILSVLTIISNKKYHYLENQFGFPYFSERFEEQNLDTRQRSIKDEFQQNYERIIKNSSSEMDDI